MPVVSVAVPAYHTARWAVRNLESMLAQTLVDLEVVIVDDASKDETPAILREFAARDPRVRLIELEKNIGSCHARNLAIDSCRGTWVAMADNDDYMTPERLERMVAAAEAAGADWLADDQYYIQDGEELPYARLLSMEAEGCSVITAAHLVERDVPETPGYGSLKPILRRTFLDRTRVRYRQEFQRCDDFLFHLECARAGAKMCLLNEAHYYYVQRKGSIVTLDNRKGLDVAIRADLFALDLFATTDSDAVEALSRRLRLLQIARRSEEIVTPVRRGEWAVAGRAVAADPAILARVARKLVAALWRRRPGGRSEVGRLLPGQEVPVSASGGLGLNAG